MTEPTAETQKKEAAEEQRRRAAKNSIVLKALGLTSSDLQQSMNTEGVSVFENGIRLGYIPVERLAPEHRGLTGPDGHPGSTGLYVIRSGVITRSDGETRGLLIHSFVPLDKIPPLKR